MENVGKTPIANMRASSLNSFTIFLLEGRAFVGSKLSSSRGVSETSSMVRAKWLKGRKPNYCPQSKPSMEKKSPEQSPI